MNFNQRFNEITKDIKLSEFSRKSGIEANTLRKYKKSSLPRLDNLIVIAEAAGVNLLWLAKGEGPIRPGNEEQKKEKKGFTERLEELQKDYPNMEITVKVNLEREKQAAA